ncbi:MAG TPA: DUF4402 domain-containing protein [Sphingomicrobium sp.]|nr:DUF4402 domain-containing protein [Sphingomicrobium sp.]
MTKIARRSLAVIALIAAPVPANAAQITAQTSANIVKPVQLTKIQDMDYGTLLVSNYSGTRNVVMSRTGTVTCPVEITCSGAPKQARFNIQGTNKMVVGISVTSGGLVNGSNTIPFTPDVAGSVTMTNSGAPGTDVDIGGTLTVDGTIPGGLYTGTLTITADYQ